MLAPYLSIMPRVKREALLAACRRADSPTQARAHAGLNRYTDAAYLLKYCQDCAADHLAMYDVTCWLAAHQTPGVWRCAAHGRPLAYVTHRGKSAKWRLPQHCAENTLTASFDWVSGRPQQSVDQVITWMAAKESLQLPALQVMVRLRVHRAGLSQGELKWDAAEFDRLCRSARAHFQAATVPDVAQVNQGDWLRLVLREHRHYNPLTWSLALAWVGETAATALDEEYQDALARKPHKDLFDELLPHGVRRTAAPRCLYDAFEDADRKSDVAAATGLPESEIDGWLRRDADLGTHWRLHTHQRRRNGAIGALRTYVEAHPNARRTDVLRECMPAYRWLETNERKTLERLLPAPAPHLATQRSLFDNAEMQCEDPTNRYLNSSGRSKPRIVNRETQ